MTVEDMREQMSPDEFIGWVAYFKIKRDREKSEQTKAQHNAKVGR